MDNELDVLSFLVRRCDNINVDKHVRYPRVFGHLTALGHAVLTDNVALAKVLVKDCGANPYITDSNSCVPLHSAANRSNADMIRVLVQDCGLDVNWRCTKGRCVIVRGLICSCLELWLSLYTVVVIFTYLVVH